MFKTSKKNKKKCQISVDNPCCYAAHNPIKQAGRNGKDFRLSKVTRVGSTLITQKQQGEGNKKSKRQTKK
jgi:hypothetical protein